MLWEGTRETEGGTRGTGETMGTGETRGAWREEAVEWGESAVMATLGDTSNGRHVLPAIESIAFLKCCVLGAVKFTLE